MRDRLYDRIEELARLRDAGLIDEGEHRAAKEALLGSVPEATPVDAEGRTRRERLLIAGGGVAALALLAVVMAALVLFTGRSWIADTAVGLLGIGTLAAYQRRE